MNEFEARSTTGLDRRRLLAAVAGGGLAATPFAASARKRRPDSSVFSRIPVIFTPDRLDMPSSHRKPGRREASVEQSALPSGPAAIRLKVNEVEARHGAWFGRNKDVYIVTTVVDGLSTEPIVYQGSRYSEIPNGGRLPIDLLNVYLRDPIDTLPKILDFSMVVIASNQSARDWGPVIGELMASKEYGELNAAVVAALTAVNPLYDIAWLAGNAALNLVGKVLKASPDDQLGYYEARFTRTFDRLGVGVHPKNAGLIHAGNMSLSYQIDVMDLGSS